MATSTTNSKEMQTTEKSDASAMSTSPSNGLFTKDVNDIREHIDNGSITKAIFQSFVDKVNAHIESLTQTNNNKGTTNSSKSTSNKQSAAAAAPPSPDAVDSAKLISESKLIASFSSLRGVSPKSKLCIEFYTDFLALIGQTKKDQNDKKCIIRYSQIERVLCVPHKNDEILLYIGLADKIDLKFRKGGIDTVMLNFEDVSGYDDDEDHISVSITNSTALPSTLKGSEEVVFCRVLSEVSKLAIERNNKMLFSTVDDSKRKIFFMEPTIKFNKCQMYPLRSGLFVFPKPTRFIAQQRIKCYEFERTGQGLRYFDVDIHLFPEPITDGTADDAKAMRKRKKDNTIQLTMVPNAEKPAMESYFAEMGIRCKLEGQATPQRKMKGGKGSKKKQSENGKEQKEEEEEEDGDDDGEGEGEDEDESSSDEEYNIEEDEDAYGNDDDASDSSGDEDEEDDIDMAEIRDVIEAGKENAAECDNQKRSVRRKRKRAEMEQSAEKEAVPSVAAKAKSGSPRKRFKRNECGNTDGKVVSKTVAKKRKTSKSPKKKIEIIELSDSDVAEEKKKVKSKSVKKSKKRKVSISLIDDDDEEKEQETEKESKSQPKIADLFKAK